MTSWIIETILEDLRRSFNIRQLLVVVLVIVGTFAKVAPHLQSHHSCEVCRAEPAEDGLQEGAQDLTAKGRIVGEELQAVLGLSSRSHFKQAHLDKLLAAGWLEMTLPGKPRSRNQRYRTTQSGLVVLEGAGS